MRQHLGGPFAAIPTWLYDVPDVSRTDIFILGVIHSFAGPSGRIYPSVEKIAERGRCSARTVQRSLTSLIACGALIRKQRNRKSDGGQATNLYFVRFDDPNLVKEFDDGENFFDDDDVTPPDEPVSPPPPASVSPKADNNLRLSRQCSYEHSCARDAREELDQFGLDDGLDQASATPEPEEPQGEQSSDPLADPVDAAFEAYNQAASVTIWSACKARTPPRRAALRKCLREFGGLEGWKQLLQRGLDSPFLTGKTRRRDGDWVANLDFFLRHATLVKLSEGAYDAAPTDPTLSSNDQRGGSDVFGRDRALAGMLRAAARLSQYNDPYDIPFDLPEDQPGEPEPGSQYCGDPSGDDWFAPALLLEGAPEQTSGIGLT